MKAACGGFLLIKNNPANRVVFLVNEDVFSLFTMTPYYYKTSARDSERLLSKSALTTTVHFGVEVYKKR